MASKYINNDKYAISGYTLSGVFQSITIGAEGSIGGPGLIGPAYKNFTIDNKGRIATISLMGDGSVTNARGGVVGGVSIRGVEGPGTVDNSGRIDGGVSLVEGLILNRQGGMIDSTSLSGDVTVENSGSISGGGYDTPTVDTTGNVTNSGKSSVIEAAGVLGVGLSLYGTLLNTGLIEATGSKGVGVWITNYGIISNTSGTIAASGKDGIGLRDDAAASLGVNGLIEATGPGGVGLAITDGAKLAVASGGTIIGTDEGISLFSHYAATLDNTGTIAATGSAGVGVTLSSTGVITNNLAGMIKGDTGIRLTHAGTVNNFGTIAGLNGGDSILFQSAGDVLIDEAGARFVGGVIGDGGMLKLAGTSGTLSGLGTSFSGFGTIDLLPGAAWAFTGAPVIGSGTASLLVDNGTLLLGAESLTVPGRVDFAGGTVAGTGTLSTSGAVTLTALRLDGGASWRDLGTAMITGALELGNLAGGPGRLKITTTGVFDIATNVGIGGVAGSIVNSGLLEKTGGTGLSLIVPAIDNASRIVVAAGTLDFHGAVSGGGLDEIGRIGTLEFDGTVAAAQTIAFAATSGGAMVLDDPAGDSLGFAGAVHGFGGSDMIDLASFALSGKPKLAWSQSGSSGTLTVTDGADVARIILFGQYAAAGFKTATDGHGGTDITYNSPAQSVTLANPQH